MYLSHIAARALAPAIAFEHACISTNYPLAHRAGHGGTDTWGLTRDIREVRGPKYARRVLRLGALHMAILLDAAFVVSKASNAEVGCRRESARARDPASVIGAESTIAKPVQL